MSASLAFVFPIDATFETVSAAIALHFGGRPVNLSTGEAEDVAFRDPAAVFTGTSQLSVSSGASPATSAPTTEVDKEGLPWDERIHSGTKSKNADGNWKLKKGVANSHLLTEVRAELMSKRSGGGVPTSPVTTGMPSTSQMSMQNDGDAARNARIAYATEQATIKAGPRTMLTDDQFDRLKRGILVEVPAAGNDWFLAWQAAFNEAYRVYGEQVMQQHAQAAATPTPTPPAMPATETAPPAAAPALDPNSVAGFAVFHASKITGNAANEAKFNEVCGMFNIRGGLGGLVTQAAMIPAVKALLGTHGIV